MLTDLACRKAAPAAEDYRLADGLGLYLLVMPSGHRSWRMGYWFAGKKKRIVLGAYPEMGLQAAREARDAVRAQVAAGVDPAVARKQAKARKLLEVQATFRVIGDAWLGERRAAWSGSYASTVERMLKNHLYPAWGSVPITAITKPMVAERLRAIEATGAIETAHRARQKVREIFDYAEALGYDLRNPSRVEAALKPVVQKQRPSITNLQQLRAMLWAIEKAPAHPVTRLASRFIALTAVRPGVAQTLTWTEIDAVSAMDPIWTIPAERMKLSQERKQMPAFDHLVPLAHQTIEILDCLRVLTGHTPYVFPSVRSARRPISDSTVSKLYRDNGYRGLHVPHGWRSSFSTIMNERAMLADRPGDRVVIDVMLAHVQEGVEPIYNRALYMPRRRELAQEWADLLLEGLPSASHLLTGRRK
ncbi:MAG: integrase [Sphingobium sp. 66-54]|nr:MAG: integrase [Sphingobium sp. 66-54]